MTSLRTPTDGTEHLDYIIEIIHDESVTTTDLIKLRDRPDILSRLKTIYSLFMQNGAIFWERFLNEVTPESYTYEFPNGRIKAFEDKDYTFSYTDLSDFGLKAHTFNELYTSIYSGLQYSIRELSEKICVDNKCEGDLGEFILPRATLSHEVEQRRFDEEDGEEYFARVLEFSEFKPFDLDEEAFFSIVKGEYSHLVAIAYYEGYLQNIRNYSLVDYDTSWNQRRPLLTKEACEAFFKVGGFSLLNVTSGMFSAHDNFCSVEKIHKLDRKNTYASVLFPGSLLSIGDAMDNLISDKPAFLIYRLEFEISVNLTKAWFTLGRDYIYGFAVDVEFTPSEIIKVTRLRDRRNDMDYAFVRKS